MILFLNLSIIKSKLTIDDDIIQEQNIPRTLQRRDKNTLDSDLKTPKKKTKIIKDDPNNRKKCNGYMQLCDRPYNKISFPGTHNSFAYAPNNIGSNQNKNIKEQLNDGIRAFTIDFHSSESKDIGKLLTGYTNLKPALTKVSNLFSRGFGKSDIHSNLPKRFKHSSLVQKIRKEKTENIPGYDFVSDSSLIKKRQNIARDISIRLCHTSCLILDAGPVEDTLKVFRDFLYRNRDEVITILIENFSSFTSEQISYKFFITGLAPYIFNPLKYMNGTSVDFSSQDLWPKLGDMIKKNHRLVVFSDRNTDSVNFPW
ncbi:hypothetical protein AYI68_g7851 [Smittium mucronatum]|uniref:PI-PLC X domain-containing protein n=1 Tax=Smittium mucronatum TaxID=133383 RepID=A0A1R0GML0_9FUNG|nr:hypothetical protein AYI68_g7851 [Smittium mucronatum]